MTSLTIKKYGDDKEFAENNANSAVLQTAIRITAQAKKLAPVDSGNMRNSIMWRVGSKEGGNTAGDPLAIRPKGATEGYVGTSVLYGIYQEFGTRKMRAQPFLRPAVDLVKGIDPDYIKQELNKIAKGVYSKTYSTVVR